MKNIKRLIFTAVLVLAFSSIAGAASAALYNPEPGPCKRGETFCFVPY